MLSFLKEVQSDEEAMRLDRWLAHHFSTFPHAWFEKALRKGHIRLNGKKASASTRVQAGHTVSLPQNLQEAPSHYLSKGGKSTKPELHAKDITFVRSLILHKDRHILVLNKPTGLAVQGGHSLQYHLDGLLDGLIFEKEFSERPRLVHRLDKETSGLIVLARTRQAAQFLGRIIVGRQMQKVYWAIVLGCPEKQEGLIDLPLIKEGGARTPYAYVKPDSSRSDPRSKPARTRYRVLHRHERVCLVELTPLDGRTHQIRVHLAKGLGTPIIGDERYGFRFSADIKDLVTKQRDTLHLHARSLTFPHPDGSSTFKLTAPLPVHVQRLLQKVDFLFL